MKRKVRLLAICMVWILMVQEWAPASYIVSVGFAQEKQDADNTVSGDGKEDMDNSSGDATASGDSSGSASMNPNAKGEFDKIEVRYSVSKLKLVYKSAFSTDDFTVWGMKEGQKDTEIAKEKCSFLVDSGSIHTSDMTSKLGKHFVCASYTDAHTGKVLNSDLFEMDVVPAQVTGIVQYAATAHSISLNWSSSDADNITGYQVMKYNEKSKKWEDVVKGGPTTNKISGNDVTLSNWNEKDPVTGDYIPLASGTEYQLRIRAFYGKNAENAVYSTNSETITCYTAPDKMNAPVCQAYTSDSITVSWAKDEKADGYLVYRKTSADASYSLVGETVECFYVDRDLKSNTTYYYRLVSYKNSSTFASERSEYGKFSTAPVAATVSCKRGNKQVRVTWKKITSSTGYQVFMKKKDDSQYTQIADIKQGTYKYVKTGLINGQEYDFMVKAYRVVNNSTYIADASKAVAVVPTQVSATSKKAKYYTTYKLFKKSKAYTTNKWFRENVNYKKSFVIPGAISTNCGGFSSWNMCPQTVLFAGSYILLTSYDKAGEENSVIYVLDKKTRKLLTVLVLPDQYHVGGIAYDGKNVWISHGTSVGVIKYSVVKNAAKKKKAFTKINYNKVIKVDDSTSYISYYKDRLYVGKYDMYKKSPMYIYKISNAAGSPELSLVKKVTMPSRIQDIAFLDDGSAIISRGSQTIAGSPQYICRLEYYNKAKWKNGEFSSLGKMKNKCNVPTLTEGIAIDNKLVYVTFESTAYWDATVPMDRVCAFPLTAVQGKKPKKATKKKTTAKK